MTGDERLHGMKYLSLIPPHRMVNTRNLRFGLTLCRCDWRLVWSHGIAFVDAQIGPFIIKIKW